MSEALSALRTSVARLDHVAGGLGPDGVRQSAYPSEWTVADVLSHLGSGAVIMRRGLEDALSGQDPDASFNQTVWDEWNAKSPDEQAAGALAADAALVAALDAVTEAQAGGFTKTMGPMTLDFDGFVALRLSEHSVHTWDIEVVADPGAAVAEESVPVMIDRLGMIAGMVGRTPGTDATVQVATTAPDRRLAVVFTPDSVRLVPSESGPDPDLSLPAEAFIRLIYGRLDPDHTPEGVGGPHLDQLRQAFPGF